MTTTHLKDPRATLDYALDWSAWLTSAGEDTLTTSAWSAPEGITIDRATARRSAVRPFGRSAVRPFGAEARGDL